MTFEQVVENAVKTIRAQLQALENVPNFCMTITAEGRLHDGDVSITYGIGKYSSTVTSHSIKPAIAEYMRREGWDANNQAKLLSFVEKKTMDEEIPF